MLRLRFQLKEVTFISFQELQKHNYLVHGANGYIVTQFLDNTANHRTDQWGGSVENRSRFGLEVLKAVKEVYGRNVSIKLSHAGGVNDVG